LYYEFTRNKTITLFPESRRSINQILPHVALWGSNDEIVTIS